VKIKRKILGIFFKLHDVFYIKKIPVTKDPQKILIAANMGLGNMLFFTPVIQNLKKKYPKVQLILLKGENQKIDHLFEAEFKYIISINLNNPSYLNLFNTILILRKEKINLAFCNFISATFYLNLILAFAKITTIVGHGTSPGFFNTYDSIYDISVPVNRFEHEIDRNLNLLVYLELPVLERKMYVKVNKRELQKIGELINDYDFKSKRPLIGIAPGSYANGWWKRWDKINYVNLIKRIHLQFPNAAFIIIGGKDDLEISNFIIKELKDLPVISLADKTSVKQLLALISRCDLLIGNDTGPIHMASALDKPAICIWGPSFIHRAHLRHETGINIWKNLHCSPCYTDVGTDRVLSCDNRLCLSEITVDEVFSAVEKLMIKITIND
jgi:heptosyltransferase-2